jgi:hypothetical protein
VRLDGLGGRHHGAPLTATRKHSRNTQNHSHCGCPLPLPAANEQMPVSGNNKGVVPSRARRSLRYSSTAVGTATGSGPASRMVADGRSFRDRVSAFRRGAFAVRRTREHEHSDVMAIEPFMLLDNRVHFDGVIAQDGLHRG